MDSGACMSGNFRTGDEIDLSAHAELPRRVFMNH